MIESIWQLSQQNLITFVMVDATGLEVPGLGAGFVLSISKNGGIFVPGVGVGAEISDGWYSYFSAAAEADTVGTVSIKVTGAGCVQQNLEYIVKQRTKDCKSFTYIVTDIGTGLPLEGVECCFSIDIAGTNIVWKGVTDVFGVALDIDANLPCLDAGTYYVWRKKTGYTFIDPDVEVVS